MANGDVILSTEFQKVIKLLDAADAATNGVWVECGDYLTGFVTVLLGGGSMSITVQGSNAATKPAAATDEAALASALTGTGTVTIATLPRYIKADGSITTGPVTAIAVLRR